MRRKQSHPWKEKYKPKQQRQQRERQELFKDHLDVNILAKCPLTIDIHSLHHQYRMCNILLLSVSIAPTRAVEGMTPNQAHVSSPMVWGWRLCTRFGCTGATGDSRVQSRSGPWLTQKCQIVYSQGGVWDLVRMYIGYCRRTSTQINMC
jgi:hypothetical protein